MNKPEQLQASDLGELIFQAGVARMRADALALAAKKAAKDLATQHTISDSHTKMLQSFARMRRADQVANPDAWAIDKQTQAERDEEMRKEFDAVEALALNAGRY